MIRVLVVDDEATQARTLRRALRSVRRTACGFPEMRIDECRSARAALSLIRERPFDVLVVDWGLEDIPGLELGRKVRAGDYAGPMMMFTGLQTDSSSECAALRAGFDDFVRKPYDALALLWRVAALARRSLPPPEGSGSSGTTDSEWAALGDDALRLSPDSLQVVSHSQYVELTLLEWKLARALYARRDHALDRSTLQREMWGDDPPANADKALESHVRELRRKLRDERGELVETVRGVGLRLRFWKRK